MALTGSEAREFVLAIDQGTSATKAVLVDLSGAVRHRSTVPITQRFPRPGWVEQDALEVWASVRQAVSDILAAVPGAHVTSVGLSTQRESTLLWDRRSGDPLGPILGWQDSRGAELCARLRAAGHSERVEASTGLPLDAMFSASKAAFLLDQYDPDRMRSRRGELCLGTVDSWLLWQLGGEHLVEAGNAARTLLLDINTGTWDPALMELFNVPEQVLPAVLDSTGPFVHCAGLELLPPHTPVSGVLGDSHAALFAHAGWRPGQVKATYGTGSSVMGIMAGPAQPVPGMARTIAWRTGDTAYAVEGNIRSAGATLTWLARLLGVTPAEVAAMAAADNDGVTIVPAFTGLGAPWWDDQALGLISGLSDSTRPEHVARAALESIALQVEDVVAAAEAGLGQVATILADGGPSANPTLMQYQADISARQVSSSQVAELSALGAAHMAGLGAALWSIDDLEHVASPHITYHPRVEDHRREQALHRWHLAVNTARALGGSHQSTS